MPVDSPSPDCSLCPRLAAFREVNRRLLPQGFNAPVPAFGSLKARLLIVGLAPGLMGANCTGRPFTGDYAGDLLYTTLLQLGFAKGIYGRTADDGLQLIDCRITNAVRCVPPQNRPSTPEIATCQTYLIQEIRAMPHLKVVVSLGHIAHRAVVAAFGKRQTHFPFAHGVFHSLTVSGPWLGDSYHCSRYNTHTGRLTASMFLSVFKRAGDILASESVVSDR